MTVGADGSIWTQANFSSYGEKSDVKAVARAIKISQNLYRWELVSGEYSALTPGITGLGGIGKAEPGFTLEMVNSHLSCLLVLLINLLIIQIIMLLNFL